MKVIQVLTLVAVLFTTQFASADVILIKKSKKNNIESGSDQHRYDDDIEKMNNLSNSLADQMVNPEKYQAKEDKNDKLQVRLISKR